MCFERYKHENTLPKKQEKLARSFCKRRESKVLKSGDQSVVGTESGPLGSSRYAARENDVQSGLGPHVYHVHGAEYSRAAGESHRYVLLSGEREF